jgi:hypothetical protein
MADVISMTEDLIKWLHESIHHTHTHTHTHTPPPPPPPPQRMTCDNEGREWNYASVNQRKSKTAGKPLEARKKKRRNPLQVSGRA